MWQLIVLAALAAPGDKASAQGKYPGIKAGATKLAEAVVALKAAEKTYAGHKRAALDALVEAQKELDQAVAYADRNDKPFEKGMHRFDTKAGLRAAASRKHPGLRDGAKRAIEAGKALDEGTTRFGGHRANAIEKINAALKELDKAARLAK
ncbi:MAG: hypothetical protein K2W96_02235 [Gemmataceae bacterium]|nr:hypothetical protein [Gemmataceae bacterium]